MNFFLSSTGSSLESESSHCCFFIDCEGAFDGAFEGTADGAFEGTADGALDGTFEGALEGTLDLCEAASGSFDRFSGLSCAKIGIISHKIWTYCFHN